MDLDGIGNEPAAGEEAGGPPTKASRPPTSLRLALELHDSKAGIAGRLYDEHGAEHAFAGWLRLLTLLEAARTRASGETNRPGRSAVH